MYIFNNTQEVLSNIDAHDQFLIATNPKMNMMKVLQEHNRSFIKWFKETIFGDDTASKTLRLLVVGQISMSHLEGI